MLEPFSLSKVNRFFTMMHSPGEHLFQLSCLGPGFYWLSNIHLAGLQLCMKGWWHWGSAERNDLVKLRSIGRRDEWVTNKRREMGNRAILSSSLLPFHNGKIVTLECACFATEDLPSLESKIIFFWDSTRVDWRMFFFSCSVLLYVSPSHISYHFVFFLSSFAVTILLFLHVIFFLHLLFLGISLTLLFVLLFWLTTFYWSSLGSLNSELLYKNPGLCILLLSD